MIEADESFHNKQSLSLVNRYATPLAVILVGSAIAFSRPEKNVRTVSLVFLFLSLGFNLSFFHVFKRVDDKSRALMAKFRASVNLWMNALMVLLLGRNWPPMWLLLMLSAVATAIYGSRQRTIVTAGFLSGVLVAINAAYRLNSPLAWGHVLAKAAFIFCTSLMINELVQLKKKDS